MVLDGRTYSVAGVMPRDFRYYPNPQAEFWTPFVLPTTGLQMVPVVARLNDGVSTDAALTEMTTVLQELRGFDSFRLSSQSSEFSIMMVAPARPALLVLACAVAFVLLIAVSTLPT